MKRTKKRIYINLPIIIAGLLLSAGFRTAALLTDWDPSYQYFRSNTLATVSEWVLFISTLFIIAEAVFNLKRNNLKAEFSTPLTYIPAGLAAASSFFIAFDLLEFVSFASDSSVLGNHIYTSPMIAIAVIAALLALASTVSFLIFVLIRNVLSHARTLLTLVISVFLIFLAAHIYLAPELPLNAPNKVLNQMTFAFSAIYFLFEARISLGREKWGGYAVFGGIAAIICAYSSIPALIAFFAKGYNVAHTVYVSILEFSLFVFIAARLTLANRLGKNESCELVSVLSPSAKERNEYIEVADRNFAELRAVIKENELGSADNSEKDENQVSLSDIFDSNEEAPYENGVENADGAEPFQE